MRASTLAHRRATLVALPKVFTLHACKTFSTTVNSNSNAALFDVAHIKSNWYPRATPRGQVLSFNPTRYWDDAHLRHFNLHFFQIEKEEDWKTYICPPANLTPDAIALSKYALSPDAFATGEHENPPHDQDPLALRQFGECIAEYKANAGSEAVSDKLAAILLYTCNCNRRLLQPLSKLPLITPVGPLTYTCILDLILAPRFRVLEEEFKYPLLSLNDKYKQVYVEPQLGAGILATAVHNYQYHNVSTTVFGMVVKGTCISLYRADFPEEYLRSIIAGSKPDGHVVIFKFSGSKVAGLDVVHCGPQRTLVLEVLSSIISFCAKEIVPHLPAKPSAVVPSATYNRLALLQDLAK